jgi:hypothetical protein
MRAFFTTLLLLAVLVAGYLAYAHFSGGQVPTFGLPIGGEKGEIRVYASQFLENIKFKNTAALVGFAENATSADVDKYLTSLFDMDKNAIDLQTFSVKEIEMDSSKMRSRVNILLKGRDLSNNNPFEKHKIIYLYQNPTKKTWLVDMNTLPN